MDLVFENLANKEYINNPVIPNTNPPNPNTKSTKDVIKEVKVIVPPNELPNLNEIVNGGTKKEVEVKRDREIKKHADPVRYHFLQFLFHISFGTNSICRNEMIRSQEEDRQFVTGHLQEIELDLGQGPGTEQSVQDQEKSHENV